MKIVEGFLSPTQELVALEIALELDFRVERERHLTAKFVHLHRMIDHQFVRAAVDLSSSCRRRLGRWHHA